MSASHFACCSGVTLSGATVEPPFQPSRSLPLKSGVKPLGDSYCWYCSSAAARRCRQSISNSVAVNGRRMRMKLQSRCDANGRQGCRESANITSMVCPSPLPPATQKMRIAAALFTCLALLADVALAAEPPPHIVVFISDDHGYEDSQVAGNTDVRTPNLVRLANAGITLTHAFAASPSCAPSRAALLTGL